MDRVPFFWLFSFRAADSATSVLVFSAGTLTDGFEGLLTSVDSMIVTRKEGEGDAVAIEAVCSPPASNAIVVAARTKRVLIIKCSRQWVSNPTKNVKLAVLGVW